MEIIPKTEFPAVYDEIFHPGRLYFYWPVWVATILGTALGFHLLPSAFGSDVPQNGQGALLLTLGLLGVSGLGLINLIVGYWRTAVGLAAEGVYYRNWLGRVWLIPWGDIQQVKMRRRGAGAHPNPGDCGYYTSMTGRARPGGLLTLTIGTSHHLGGWRDIETEIGNMTRGIIERAGLVPGPPLPGTPGSDRVRTWVRPDTARGGPGPASGEPGPPECKWCGETFPVGTTKCPLCGRPLSVKNSI